MRVRRRVTQTKLALTNKTQGTGITLPVNGNNTYLATQIAEDHAAKEKECQAMKM